MPERFKTLLHKHKWLGLTYILNAGNHVTDALVCIMIWSELTLLGMKQAIIHYRGYFAMFNSLLYYLFLVEYC